MCVYARYALQPPLRSLAAFALRLVCSISSVSFLTSASSTLQQLLQYCCSAVCVDVPCATDRRKRPKTARRGGSAVAPVCKQYNSCLLSWSSTFQPFFPAYVVMITYRLQRARMLLLFVCSVLKTRMYNRKTIQRTSVDFPQAQLFFTLYFTPECQMLHTALCIQILYDTYSRTWYTIYKQYYGTTAVVVPVEQRCEATRLLVALQVRALCV